jgi:energy-coupling factor transporter ATP-binding protein EcfA2
MTDTDWSALGFEVQQTFSPSAPLDESSLFAGRRMQLQKVLDATAERGKHVILFGERGAGKTSLAKLVHKLFPPTARSLWSVREQCDPSDDFDSIWRKVFKDIWVQVHRDGEENQRPLAELYVDKIKPDDVRRELEAVFKPSEIPIIIIDELDKVRDLATRGLVANTIKHLSDYSVNVTIILVGVADDVNGLIGEHESIGRCLEQVVMPRMSMPERREVLEKILPRLGMRIDSDALAKVASLSRGLPSYVHSLGQSAALAAIQRKSLNINENDVDAAVRRVLEKSEESVQENYAKAVHSNRNDSMYREVLLACALAETNDRGTFAPAAVCVPLTGILKREKQIEISAFQQHLQKFITPERNHILVRIGHERSYRYRFADPMMQPYVIMKGVEQELVDPRALEALSTPAQLSFPSI